MGPDSQEDHDDGEELPSRGQGKRYITQRGAQRLHKELLHLLNEERPKVTSEVSAAAAQGDRSENAEYIYGKKRLREIDRRIRFLTKTLDASTVVIPAEQTDLQRVYFGATVSLQEQTFQVVGPDETDTKGGLISVDSPIGRALLGKRAGEQVTVSRPLGEIDLKILTIKYL
jgi:transcription elongation factor GreB